MDMFVGELKFKPLTKDQLLWYPQKRTGTTVKISYVDLWKVRAVNHPTLDKKKILIPFCEFLW